MFGRFVCVFGACVCVFGWVRVCEFCVFVYVDVWFSVSGCMVARLRLNLCKHTQDLGFTCKFGGGVFSHVLRPHFLRRVRPCTIGYTRAWRELHACVHAVAQPRSNLLRAIIPMAWRARASLAVAVSAMCYVGGFCAARCRALLDKHKLGTSVVRLCGRAVAFQPAVRSHTKDLRGACNVGGGGPNGVLRLRFLRRVLPRNIGSLQGRRKRQAYVCTRVQLRGRVSARPAQPYQRVEESACTFSGGGFSDDTRRCRCAIRVMPCTICSIPNSVQARCEHVRVCVYVCVRVCVRAVAVQASARSQANSLRDGARKFNSGAQSCLASEVRAASDVVYYKIIKHYALVYTFIHCAAYVRLRGCVTS